MAQELPNCPVEITMQLIGNKWKVLIIRDLLNGTRRFSELKRSATGITQKVLTANLRALEENGLLTRAAYAEVPPRVEYTLTATGYSLKPVLDAMSEWGECYRQEAAVEKARPKRKRAPRKAENPLPATAAPVETDEAPPAVLTPAEPTEAAEAPPAAPVETIESPIPVVDAPAEAEAIPATAEPEATPTIDLSEEAPPAQPTEAFEATPTGDAPAEPTEAGEAAPVVDTTVEAAPAELLLIGEELKAEDAEQKAEEEGDPWELDSLF